jgi:hypothetical protein
MLLANKNLESFDKAFSFVEQIDRQPLDYDWFQPNNAIDSLWRFRLFHKRGAAQQEAATRRFAEVHVASFDLAVNRTHADT